MNETRVRIVVAILILVLAGSAGYLCFNNGTAVTPSPSPSPSGTPSTYYSGISGYTDGISGVDQVVSLVKELQLNVWRASFVPSWEAYPGLSGYSDASVNEFLSNCSADIIVDRNHLYPPGSASDSDAVAHWTDVESSVMEVLQEWKNNPRVWVEIINEYTGSDLYKRVQSLVTTIRKDRYTNPIVINKMNQPWTVINDPLGETYQGSHYYFDYMTAYGAISDVKEALSMGIKLVCTEVGANSKEYHYFDSINVGYLQSYLNQCAALGVGNCVWMNENVQNYPTYESFGLIIPEGIWRTPLITQPVSSVSELPHQFSLEVCRRKLARALGQWILVCRAS